MSRAQIPSILEAASIEPPKARAIAESLEVAFREQEDDLTKRLMTNEDGAKIRAEIKTSIAELRTEMDNFKAEIIKWMFLFWIGQMAATAAIVKLLQ
jgi:DNA-binding transcriptional MerR regulator